MADFEWRVLDEESTRRARELAPGFPRWLIRAGIVVAGLLSLAGVFLAIQDRIARQAEEAASETKRDILASHHLVERAVIRSDRDLFVTLLPGDDPAWSKSQQELFDNGLAFRRDRLGLVAQTGGSNVVSVTLSSAPGRGEVVLDQAYTTTPRSHLCQPGISLSLDWSGDGRWLIVLDDGILHLVEPDGDYQRTVVPDSPGCMVAVWIDR